MSSIAHIPGVQIVQKGNFVGVVAPLEWNAIQAAEQLQVAWDNTPKLSGNGNLNAALRDPAKLQSGALAVNTGDVGAALAGAAKTVSASYFTAYQMHGARSARTARSPTSRPTARRSSARPASRTPSGGDRRHHGQQERPGRCHRLIRESRCPRRRSHPDES